MQECFTFDFTHVSCRVAMIIGDVKGALTHGDDIVGSDNQRVTDSLLVLDDRVPDRVLEHLDYGTTAPMVNSKDGKIIGRSLKDTQAMEHPVSVLT